MQRRAQWRDGTPYPLLHVQYLRHSAGNIGIWSCSVYGGRRFQQSGDSQQSRGEGVVFRVHEVEGVVYRGLCGHQVVEHVFEYE